MSIFVFMCITYLYVRGVIKLCQTGKQHTNGSIQLRTAHLVNLIQRHSIIVNIGIRRANLYNLFFVIFQKFLVDPFVLLFFKVLVTSRNSQKF